MLPWLQSLDTAAFRFINLKLGTPWLDPIMRALSGTSWFIPAVVLLAAWLLWKGGARGRLFVLILALVIAAGDSFVINQLKHLLDRARPFADVADIRLLVGKGDSNSFPSSHTATWFAATLVAMVFYRRTFFVMLPLASLVGFSRIYLGAHYPSDVLGGAILGLGYAAAGVWLLEASWRRFGIRWFPLWGSKLPSLINLRVASDGSASVPTPALVASQDLHLSYAIIALLLLARLVFISTERFELSEAEAMQWLEWKHFALSGLSNPPLPSLTQFLGIKLWGENEFGVRFLAPILGALSSLLVVRFMAREVSARAGLLLTLVLAGTPLVAAGSILMTKETLLALFWSAAMITGWQAIQADGSKRHWVWTGGWTGLAFLTSPAAFFLLAGWLALFTISPPARPHLRRPGPWLALGISLLGLAPMLLWNAFNDRSPLRQLTAMIQFGESWKLTIRYPFDFIVSTASWWHPVFFFAALWAAVAVWQPLKKNLLQLYLFAMSVPLLLVGGMVTLRFPVTMLTVAPLVVPLFCLLVAYWSGRWRDGVRFVRPWFIGSLIAGVVVVILAHDTRLTYRLVRVRVPAQFDPTLRLQGLEENARLTAQARTNLMAEGREVFVITAREGLAATLTFYTPAARNSLPYTPLVYPRLSRQLQDPFRSSPLYRYPLLRLGQNAIYVAEVKAAEQAPDEILAQFQSVTDLGVKEVRAKKQVVRRLQFFACRGLR